MLGGGILDWEFWEEVFFAITKNKLRALLTACGVFWGVFMLVTMLGIGSGMQRGTQKTLGDMQTRAVFIWSQRTSLPYRGRTPGRYLRLRNDDIQALRQLPGVEHVAPRLQLGAWRAGENVVAGNRTGNFTVHGDSPEFRFVEPFELVRGRFLNQRDLAESRKVAVIGDQTREVLFGDTSPLGKYLQVKGIHLLIVGEFTTDRTGDDAERLRSSLSLPFSTFQRVFNQRNRVGWFALAAAPNASPEAVESAVKATLGARHGVHPDDPDAFGSMNLAREVAKVEGLFQGIRGFVWLVGTLTLLAGVLGVSNILLVTVKERTREIGVRKALGATPWSIVSMVVAEAVVLTSISGYAGLVASVGSLELLSQVLERLENVPLSRPEVDLRVGVGATLILVVSGALAGVVPARHAARISPVEALRNE